MIPLRAFGAEDELSRKSVGNQALSERAMSPRLARWANLDEGSVDQVRVGDHRHVSSFDLKPSFLRLGVGS